MKKQLTRATLLITALALLLSGMLAVVFFRQREIAAAHRGLDDTLAILDAQRMDTDAHELVRQFSAAAPDRRLTLISPEGEVLADSVADTDENHATRAEVVQALETGTGEATRQSATTGETYLYVARRFTDGVIGRAAVPLGSVNSLILQGAVVMVVGILVALGLTLLVARRWAEGTAKPIEARQLKLENVRSEFAANVSHELKTPLTSIKGFTDMLASGMVADPADQKRFFTMIGVEVDRLMELIGDLLKLSELESVVMPRPEDRAEGLAVCQNAAQALELMAKERQVALTVEGRETFAAIPPSRLREVVSNLMENGLKYTEAGGRVAVTVDREGDALRLRVADTGIGIPKEAMERIFERFYRVDKGRTRAAGGSGLGLAIVKHIAQLYGGSVALESETGKGSTFTVKFPLAQGEREK